MEIFRKKFSVRHFWQDCHRYKCNGAQYIGEICRYLLSAPELPEEKLHKVLTYKSLWYHGNSPDVFW
jgi:hypothetical protein